MAIVACRECGGQVSTEAKKCPHCGVSNPSPKKASVGVFGWIAVVFVGFLAFSTCSSFEKARPNSTSATDAPLTPAGPSAQQLAQEQREAENERLAKMSPKETVAYLKPKLLSVCQAMNRSFNHLDVVQRDGGLFCVHEFYTQYSLSAGPLASALNDFITEHKAQLLQAKLNKVGVYGRGEYASGQWYKVD